MNESVFITRARQILPALEEKSLLAAMDEVLPYLEWESLKNAADWLRRYAAQPELAAEDEDGVRGRRALSAILKRRGHSWHRSCATGSITRTCAPSSRRMW